MRYTRKIPTTKKKVSHQQSKRKFRGSKEWKEFRQYMRSKQKVDPITGAKLTAMANLHHLDLNDEHYEDLSDETHFVFLNQAMHKVVHALFLKSDPKAWRKRVLNLIRILKQMEAINEER